MKIKTRGMIAGVTALAFLSSVAFIGNANAAANSNLRLHGNSTNAPAINAMIAAFREVNPYIKITPTFYGVSDGQAAMMTQLLAGTAADILQVYPGSGAVNSVVQLAQNGYLAPLPYRKWSKNVLKDDVDLRYGGQTYGVPQTAQGVGYIYSPEIMAKSGLTPPTKWSEVKPFCVAAKGKGTPAYATGWATGWPTIMSSYAVTATLIYGKDPAFTTKQYAGKATFATSAWVKSFQMMLDMNTWGCFADSPNATTYAMVQTQLATGKVLGWLGLPTVVPSLQAIAPAGTTWSFAAHPATENAAETVIPSSNLVAYSLNAKASGNVFARKFIDFLASEEAIKIQLKLSGGIPVVPIAGYVPTSPAIKVIMDYRAKKKFFTFVDHEWKQPQIQQALISGVQGLFAGTETPQSVAAKMDAALLGK